MEMVVVMDLDDGRDDGDRVTMIYRCEEMRDIVRRAEIAYAPGLHVEGPRALSV
jgi:hypothetical protein